MTETAAGSGAQRAGFVHLRLHTAYSLLEGAMRIKSIAGLCRDQGMPAVAMTDSGNLFGAFEFSQAVAGGGVQPIIGCTLTVDVSACLEEGRGLKARHEGTGPEAQIAMARIALLVKDEEGWLNLSALSSKSYLETSETEDPHVTLDMLAAHQAGLIALTGGPDGPVNRLIVAGRSKEGAAVLDRLAEIFADRLYVELQRHGLPAEDEAETHLVPWAYERDLPLVATNQVYFPERDMYEAHDALICIAAGAYVIQQDRRRLTAEHYFKTPEEMSALFSDLPEAIENTVVIARRCAFRVKKHKPILPAFEIGEGRDTAEELRHQASEGLKRRMADKGTHGAPERYWDRLDYELGVITRMGFEGYFLIVSDFMKWARARNIPIGVRGSGATSIVAWCLDITNLDPLRFDLVFERFLNPERVSMPDFDIDFCQDRRQEVIEYVQGKYGADKVAQIITFGTLQARAVVRDVGRVLQMPYGQVDRICKMIPNPPGKAVKLSKAIEDEPRLQAMIEEEDAVRALITMALKLEGLYRHASTHAAGLVIGDKTLHERVPLYRDPRADMPVTQFHFKDAESVGLVKFDFLGLKTLTVIAKTEELLQRRGIELNTQDLEFDDVRTFEMLARGDSIGVFQLESSGMRDLLRKMKPDRIEDLIALVALYRPGPMESIPKYIACKHGREEPIYLHPLLEPILEETFGVMTYQEDVMQIARDLAGYSLGEADLLRRAMGKKIQAEMAKHRVKFVEGSAANGVSPEIAEQIFEQAAKFAGYGFNKGHAAAYAQVAYQTAYLKANYPVEFLSASMTLDMERTDRLAVFRQEAERLDIPVVPPDVNRSEVDFVNAVDDDGKPVILYALAALKTVGRAAMDHLVAVRSDGGPFRDLGDFAHRIDPRFINKRAVEGLAKAGAFDALEEDRARVHAGADRVVQAAAAALDERAQGQANLFAGTAMVPEPLTLPMAESWSGPDQLRHELEIVGFYLSGHPLEEHAKTLRRAGVQAFAELTPGKGRARLAGAVMALNERKSKSGRPFGVCELSEPTGRFEIWIFSELLTAARERCTPEAAVVVDVTVDWEDEEPRLTAQDIRPVEAFTASIQTELEIVVDRPDGLEGIRTCLDGRQGGRCAITLALQLDDGLRQVPLQLADSYRVDGALRSALKSLPGVVHIEEL
ncbi:MAG: DNA polymerase III subunit alpha [Alphaproteobacteria bacterium]